MNNSNLWIEIAKILIPSLAVFGAAYIVMKTFIDKELATKRLDLKIANQKIITPIRLQAYERLVLFLERISPENLLVRVYVPGMTPQQYHKQLLQTIRDEYEHNLSQQVYVSEEAWEAVKSAKESILKLINLAASSEKGQKSAQEISRIIIEAYSSVETSPISAAIETLKKELQEQIF